MSKIVSAILIWLLVPHALAQPLHGLSVFGSLKHPANFQHFDYVNPNAPKGGILSNTGAPLRIPNGTPLTFDSLNGYILKGNGAQGLEMTFDSLMVRNFDEPDAVYGLVAKNVEIGKDAKSAIFNLRQAARFHDGTKLSAGDVAFSLNLLKAKGHPLIAAHLKHLTHARAISPHRLSVKLSSKLMMRSERMHFLIFLSQLPIFSKAYYTKHDFTKTSLKAALGSGPYRLLRFKVGQYVIYERVKNYWAQHLPVNKGRWNFDQIRFEYFRDRHSEFEAFKAGVYRLREEYVSKIWAKQYDFPAVKDGRVQRLVLSDHTPSGAQGWFINMRRKKFQHLNVRKALSYAFDFEWTNRNQFYGLYRRTESFFENSPLKAHGTPNKAERALLLRWQTQLPKEVFGTAISAPRSDGSGQDRQNLRLAARLLDEGGWRIKQGKRQNQEGQILKIEFMTDSPSFERIIQPFIKNLRLLGIEARVRIVDAAQYQQRLRRFDFDLTTRRFTIANTPGIELRNLFSSQFADIAGSLNLSGIQVPVVDALVESVIAAPSRSAQKTAAHSLDRVLRALYVWVPQWHNDKHHIAYWGRYGSAQTKPIYARGILDCWWDAELE